MTEPQQEPRTPVSEQQQRAGLLLHALMAADVDEKRRLIETEWAILLNPACEAGLRQASEAVMAAGDENRARFFAGHAALLAAYRQGEVPEVFTFLAGDERAASQSNAVPTLMAMLQAMEADDNTDSDAKSDLSRVGRKIDICERLLALVLRQEQGDLWAHVQGALGNALSELGAQSGDAAVLRAAEAAFRDLLLECTRERSATDWATAQNDLGIVLSRLGDLTGDVGAMRAAEVAFRVALEERTRERESMNWAATQNNLGIVLHHLGGLTGDVGAMRAAEEAYRLTLEEWTRERVPLNWAMTQNNLGTLLQHLGDLTGDVGALRAAEAAFCAALEERTRERMPIEWAMTLGNLGIVLASLGRLTGDAELLRNAVGAFHLALTECTQERSPAHWSMVQSNLGMALSELYALTKDETFLRLAEIELRAALDERTRERMPMAWVETQNNLAGVLQILGERTGDDGVLRAAEAAYRDALLECTRERMPTLWAGTQNNLARVLNVLGERTGDAGVLRAAEAAYRDALLEFSRERAPINWARAHTGLGDTLRCLGDLTGDAALLDAAGAAFRAAMAAYNESGAEDARQEAAVRLAYMLVRRLRYEEAAAAIEPTLACSDAALMDAARSRDGGMRVVEQVGDLYGLLSVCRLRQPTPDRVGALIAAESGRARLLTDALALDAVRLEQINDRDIQNEISEAQDRRAVLRHRLGHRNGSGMELRPDQPTLALTSEERERMQAELRKATDAYVALCRRHGLIRVPTPLSLAEILAAAPTGGALLLPVVTETEAFALVVAGGTREPTVIELPRLNRKTVFEHLTGEDGWLGVYNMRFHDHETDAVTRAAAAKRWHGQLTATLAWLWERLLGLVHAHLRDVARLEANAPVVILAPGLLGLLPLQAGGPDPDGRHFGEHWTVSYAPSVRALLTCQRKAEQCLGLPAKLLAVIDPPSDTPLLGAQQEAAMLRQRFASVDPDPVILEGGEATLTAVLAHLSHATCFHASTHGWHDPYHPMQSGLHLADTPLLLEALRETRFDAARLVFLSACESGRADIRRLPEEFIGLPAGFVQARAACVIAALWPIRDDAAFVLADKFYELYLNEAGVERASPVVALRAAVHWLRRAPFGILKQRFPQADGPDGPVLVLSTMERFKPVGETRQQKPVTKLEGIRLPLGDDDECPYAAATHWAAFTVTGA